MDEIDLEGTRILEKLAALGKVDEFLEAVDSDNFEAIRSLLKMAKVDKETADLVIEYLSK